MAERRTRVFVAVSLPTDIKQHIAALQKALRKTGIRASWTGPETMHLTLRFVGDVTDEQLTALREGLGRSLAECGAARLRVQGAGAFPNMRRPNVVWAGLEVTEGDLRALRAAVDNELRGLGLPEDNKPFRPHITIGRIRPGRDTMAREAFAAAMGEAGEFNAGEFEATHVSLFASELRSSGAVHTLLQAYELKSTHGTR